ncbi:MAG: hypothetical protein JJU02_02000 [Cryomorphaceae bacterium]|nr:hypothetical protein [Cryomorphaceae bacterium]
MTNRYFPLFLFICFASNCFAQKKECISLSSGPSIPIGVFASKNPNNNRNNTSGYANTGMAIDFSYTWLLYKNHGIVGAIYTQLNPTDHQSLVDDLSQQNSGAGNILEGAWSTGAIFFGVYSSYSLTKKLRIEPQLLFGFRQSEAPGFKAYNLDGPSGYPSWINQDITHSKHAILLIARTVFKYELGTRLCILANLDFLATNPEFKDRKTMTNLETQHHTFTQKIRTLNFTLGIGYMFN